jgi:hypothetical protein
MLGGGGFAPLTVSAYGRLILVWLLLEALLKCGYVP